MAIQRYQSEYRSVYHNHRAPTKGGSTKRAPASPTKKPATTTSLSGPVAVAASSPAGASTVTPSTALAPTHVDHAVQAPSTAESRASSAAPLHVATDARAPVNDNPWQYQTSLILPAMLVNSHAPRQSAHPTNVHLPSQQQQPHHQQQQQQKPATAERYDILTGMPLRPVVLSSSAQ
ncbi:hypothetical protein CXG81DRAFT_18006 [Caulochytrium protostelioides]|uniref:Uncharacterized protein n=1 Tax=Caulochytrium protostelioides TaxID=1555241 RepID=A0A4P9XAI0_9FUNG|nr:hypothetical protein CXG81DRAFT_18006 [Caulochytrium protostelioides]|eukprot:RKP02342.1 hypothetical protein CXG81DRAFT_18006 [Caulochytrium protostelioides]